MNNITIFIPSDFELSAKIADLLRINNIKTTNNIHEATVVLAKDNSIDIDKLLEIAIQRIESVPPIIEPILLLSEKNKKTYTKYQIQKNFNKAKQIQYKHAYLNRIRKR